MIVLENVSLICVKTGLTIPHQSIVVDAQKIVIIGSTDSLPLYSKAHYIDGTGKYVIPGLVDSHVHLLTRDDLLWYVSAGVTSVRNMWGMRPHFLWRSAIEKGSLLGPTIYTAGPIIDGCPPIWKGAHSITSQEEVLPLIERHKKIGADFFKVYSALPEDVYYAILDTAKSLGLPVDGHVPVASSVFKAIEHGQRCIEHLSYYLETCQKAGSPAVGSLRLNDRIYRGEFLDDKALDALVESTRNSQVWNCPTLSVIGKLYEYPEPLSKFLANPMIEQLHPLVRSAWKIGADTRIKDLTDEGRARLNRLYPLYHALVSKLYQAGARIVLGTDTGIVGVIPGYTIFEEVERFSQAGIKPLDILRMMTLYPAQMLGKEKEFGTLEAGLRADFVVLNSNPLEDISKVADQHGVMIRGQWYTTQDLRHMLSVQSSHYQEQLKSNTFLSYETYPEADDKNKNCDNFSFSIRYNGTEIGHEAFYVQRCADPSLMFIRENFVFRSYEHLDFKIDMIGSIKGLFQEVAVHQNNFQTRLVMRQEDGYGVRVFTEAYNDTILNEGLRMTGTKGSFIMLHSLGCPLNLDHLPLISSMFFLYQHVKRFDIDDFIEINAVDVDIAMHDPYRAHLIVTRKDDRRYADTFCSVFSIIKETRNCVYEFILFVDQKTQVPVGLIFVQDLGIIEYVREV